MTTSLSSPGKPIFVSLSQCDCLVVPPFMFRTISIWMKSHLVPRNSESYLKNKNWESNHTRTSICFFRRVTGSMKAFYCSLGAFAEVNSICLVLGWMNSLILESEFAFRVSKGVDGRDTEKLANVKSQEQQWTGFYCDLGKGPMAELQKSLRSLPNHSSFSIHWILTIVLSTWEWPTKWAKFLFLLQVDKCWYGDGPQSQF